MELIKGFRLRFAWNISLAAIVLGLALGGVLATCVRILPTLSERREARGPVRKTVLSPRSPWTKGPDRRRSPLRRGNLAPRTPVRHPRCLFRQSLIFRPSFRHRQPRQWPDSGVRPPQSRAGSFPDRPGSRKADLQLPRPGDLRGAAPSRPLPQPSARRQRSATAPRLHPSPLIGRGARRHGRSAASHAGNPDPGHAHASVPGLGQESGAGQVEAR